MSYYSKPDSHIRNKFKVELDLSTYATKKNQIMLQALIHLTQLLKKDFIALKAEVKKSDINKLVNGPTRLNNLKTKVDNLDIGKLKTFPVELKIK